MALEYLRFEEMTLRQLRRVASEYRIPRYSRLRKAQLLAAVRGAERERPRVSSILPPEASQMAVEASKYELGGPREPALSEILGSVDENLSELPATYAEGRIVLMPRDPYWCFAYWDIPAAARELLRQEARTSVLRLYEVAEPESNTGSDLQEYPCDVEAREMYLPVPLSDRDYRLEIGYHRGDTWVCLARSAAVRVPPVYPSAWVEDRFVTLDWDRDLQEQVVPTLEPPQAIAATRASMSLLTALAGTGPSPQAAAAGSLFGYLVLANPQNAPIGRETTSGDEGPPAVSLLVAAAE